MKNTEMLTLIINNQVRILRHLGLEPATLAEPVAIPAASKAEVFSTIIESLYELDMNEFRTSEQIRKDIGKALGCDIPQKDSYHLGRILSQSFPVGTKLINKKVQRGYAIKLK
jgi:hypothetical protein